MYCDAFLFSPSSLQREPTPHRQSDRIASIVAWWVGWFGSLRAPELEFFAKCSVGVLCKSNDKSEFLHPYPSHDCV